MDIKFSLQYTDLEYHALKECKMFYPDYKIPYAETSNEFVIENYNNLYHPFYSQIKQDEDTFNKLRGTIDNYFDNIFPNFSHFKSEAILAVGTLLPVYPRCIETRTLLYPIHKDNKIKIGVITHEINHFLFYRVGAEKGINTESKEFWELSEIFAVISTWNDLYQRNLGEKRTSHYVIRDNVLFEKIYKYHSLYGLSNIFYMLSINYLKKYNNARINCKSN